CRRTIGKGAEHMGEKVELKRKYIVETARKVFAQKGYTGVTMKDVVEACNISRGGLYLYFDNIRSLFEEVLANEEASDDQEVEKDLSKASSDTDLFAIFIKEQKKDILQKESLLVALYEYSFSLEDKKKNNFYKSQYEAGELFLTRLLENGKKHGEFAIEEPKKEARHIMISIEGLKILRQSIGISERQINEELLYLLSGIVAEE
ncbi:MAG TPA: TetR family transcriptional regulator, partial [Lachnospiraceae bacterium]|nr:TetR family transcriptional regulator [Lachnospiraceae bacterium]